MPRTSAHAMLSTMAIPAHLLAELLALPPEQRLEVATLLERSVEEEEPELDDEDLDRLHRSLHAAVDEMRAGHVIPALPFLDSLRDRDKP
jgi:hypothetical protein